jgi:hypothetical protein
MSARRIFGLSFGVIVIAVVAAFVVHYDTKPVGRLRGSDVRAIRAAVTRFYVPWTGFTWTGRNTWPAFIWKRLTFQITELRPSTVATTTIHPDGTRVEQPPTVSVSCRGYLMGESHCTVVKENGKWMVMIGYPPILWERP